MNDRSSLQRVQQDVQRGAYRLTAHAERELEEDHITIAEIVEAFGNGQVELFEDYPDDPRGRSFLVLGFTTARSPIHAVIGLARRELVFVTIYRPAQGKWYDWRRRV